MRLDRIVGGMCLGMGATRLILDMGGDVFNWILVGLGLLAVALYCIENYMPGFSDSCKKYNSMTNEERIEDCKRRIAEKEREKLEHTPRC